MSTTLRIHIYSRKEENTEDIEFFKANSWTSDTEQQFLVRIRDLLSIGRMYGISFKVNIDLEVTDMASTVMYVKKKMKKEVIINHEPLSVREIEVLGHIMQGMTNHEIANKLFISYETVRSHRKNILRKTGAKNTAALINYYHQTFFD